MFSYHENGLKKTKESIDITFKMLQSLIKANSYYEQIEQLRKLEYGSPEYKKFKIDNTLPCCKPHGVFKNIYDKNLRKNKEVLQELSGYLYFDIDNCDIPVDYKNDIDNYKKIVIAKYAEYISMLGKSVGGRGIFFLVKVNGLTEENFISVHEYFRNMVFKDIPIDTDALGIARNFFIPLDEDVYVNENVISKAEISTANIINKKDKGIARCIKGGRSVLGDDIHLSIPLTSYIPIEELLSIINMKTPVDTKGNSVVVKPLDFIKCFIPKKIHDDCKHKTFSGITNVLVHLNPHLPIIYFKSFIWWVNQNYTCGKKMLQREMEAVVQYAYYNSKTDGLWDSNKKWLRTKWIHFDKACGYTPIQKLKIAARLTGDRKIAETTDIIKSAISELEQSGIPPTQVKVIERLREIRSPATIKKYWKVIYPKVAIMEAETFIEHIQLEEQKELVIAPKNSKQTPSTISAYVNCQQHDISVNKIYEMDTIYDKEFLHLLPPNNSS
jgi:hypothetical protein